MARLDGKYRSLLVLALIMALLAGGGPRLAEADGAIALSNSTSKLGAVQGFGSRQAAEAAALLQCDETDCKILSWYSGAVCIAAAQGEGGITGSWASYADVNPREVAVRLSTFHCMRQGGTNCTLIAVVCN